MDFCLVVVVFFFFKQKTAYEMRISDWSSDVCSSDLARACMNSTSPEALLQSPSLSFNRISAKAFFVPSGSRRGSRKQLSPPGACASTRNPSDIGAEKNHLCPTSAYSSPPSDVAVVVF